MTQVDRLKAVIEELPSEEFAELFHWLRERLWERWDQRIEADSEAGALDFLIREAREEGAEGRFRDL